MNKILVYTSNPDRTPMSMSDVTAFAKRTGKYRLANVELSPIKALRSVNVGDRVFTKKGNTIYVIRTFDTCLDDLSAADKEYIQDLYAAGMKTCNIGAVNDVTPFNEWCRSASAKEALDAVNSNCSTTKKDSKKMTGSMKTTFLSKIKSQFLPVKVEGARLTVGGEVAVINPEKNGYRVISSTGKLTDYPEEMTLAGLPVYSISRPISDIVEGDIIESAGKFYKVTGKKGDNLSTICYTGTTRTKIGVTDALLGITNFNVIVSLVNGNAGINPLMLAYIMNDGKKGGEFDLKDFLMINAFSQNGGANLNNGLFGNPLMFLLLSEKNEGIDPLMFLLMGNNGGANNIMGNPLMAMALLGDKEGGENDMLKTMLMMSAFGGNNGGVNLGGLFGNAAAPVAAAPAEAATKKPARKARSTKKAEAAAE